ncbi:MAG: 50S ribosomal protein L11 methyltransferase [Thermodesulfobacteriota bacterium]
MLRPPYERYQRLHISFLDRIGLPAVDDPDLIGVWEEDGHTVLFFHQPKEALVEALCQASGAAVTYRADLDYQDWEAGRPLTPFSVAGLAIAPVWAEGPADIRLDPGVAFGSGSHPTTRCCLTLVLELLADPGCGVRRLADLGTGTGIVAVAAAFRHPDLTVEAFDHNPLACAVARANAARNGVAGRVRVRQVDLRQTWPVQEADLIVANLYRELLLALMARPAFWQARWHILSGFRSEMEPDLLAALPAGVCCRRRLREDGWVLWLLEQPARCRR